VLVQTLPTQLDHHCCEGHSQIPGYHVEEQPAGSFDECYFHVHSRIAVLISVL
jgi:hypothetical protein